MAAASLTTLSAVMKQFYLGPLQDQLNNEIMAFDLFQKTKVDWVGKEAIIPVRTARNNSPAFSATAALPPVGSQTYASLTVEAKYLYGRMQIDGPAIAQAKASVGAFINGLQVELDGAMETVKNACDQALFTGAGGVGFLNEREAFGANAAIEFSGNIDLIPEGAGAKVAGTLVRLDTYKSIAVTMYRDAGAKQHIKFDAAVDTRDIDGAGTAAAGTAHLVIIGAKTEESMGIYGNLGEKTHFGVDRSTGANVVLQSIIRAANLAGTGDRVDLSTGRMQAMIDDIATESGSTPDCMLAHYVFRQQYVGQLSFVTTTEAAAGIASTTSRTKSVDNGDAGFDMGQLAFNGIPLKVSRHCGKGLLIFLHTRSWALVQIEDPNLADLDGNVLSRVSASDSYEAYVRYYYNLVCKQPNRNAILVGLNFPA
tara:strand:+ start:1503 stop:2777 length:1275 start_codon:yes stop_codon:yes gene_type:complete